MSADAPSPEGAAAPPSRLVIGSRRSRLAREQALRVGRRLEAAWPELEVRYLSMETRGDRAFDRPLPELGGKGIFTAELETALREGRVDLAVHSLKDLPTEETRGLVLAAVPEREDPRDVLVSNHGPRLEDLPEGASVGTSSLRRVALLLRRRPGCRGAPVRGNVDTRLRKLDEERFDALVLAAAGLRRLGRLAKRLADGRAGWLDPRRWLPAPGQGALGVQARAGDASVLRAAGAIDDPVIRARTTAERAFLAALGGGCRVPIGAHARVVAGGEGERLELRGIVLAPDGREAVEGEVAGPLGEPGKLGRRLAEELAARGAGRLLASALN